MKRALLLLIPLLLASCQTKPEGPMPPNQFTFNAPKVQVKEAIIKTFIPAGYQLVKDSDFQLVLDRPANDNFAAKFLFGSEMNGTPNARAILTITGDNPTEVISQLSLVTNPGTGVEIQHDLSNNADMRGSLARGMEKVRAALPAK